MNGKIVVPLDFKKNTVAVLGIEPSEEAFYAELRVYANEDGRLLSTDFAGYCAHIGIDMSGNHHKIHIDDAWNGNKELPVKRFNRRLMKKGPKPERTFKVQRMASAVAR